MNAGAALDANFATTMANYNNWMNKRLYDVVSTLDDETRKKHMGAFFESIHGTLNHILLADKVWMGRFVRDPFIVQALSEELYADFDELKCERGKQDRRIVDWASGLSAEELAKDLCFVPLTTSQEKVLPMWLVVTHFFNHQTHHRGQITTLLMQLGIDPGATDLPVMPRSQ